MTQMHALPDSRDTLARPSVHLVSGDLLGWLHEKLAAAEKSLAARRQGAECWRSGTAKEWKAVGNKMTKAQRIAQADGETRIAAKYQRDVNNYRTLILRLQDSPEGLRAQDAVKIGGGAPLQPNVAYQPTPGENQ